MSEKIKGVVKRLRDRAEARRRSGKLLQIDDRMFDLIADEIEEAAVKVLEADRDNWRRQALDEDARANAINFAANTNVDAKVYSKRDMAMDNIRPKDNIRIELVRLRREVFAILNKDKDSKADFIPVILGSIDMILGSHSLRNYAVGTAEEQYERWQKFCDTQARCEKCPCNKEGDISAKCFARWSQMPYKEISK